MPHINRFVPFGGGLAIKIDDLIIGGVGVSGGSAYEDVIVAESTLTIIG